MYKHVLHDHLDGGLRPSTAKELAESINYKPLLDIDNVESFFDRSSSDSLEEYLEAFTHTIALMQNYSSIERIAFEAAEDMHLNGINFYESRYAPFYSVNNEMTPLDVIDAVNSGFKIAENTYGIRSGLILCGMRHDTKDVLNVANLCLEAKDKIIGFDIAGPELNYPPSLFRESFKKVKELGVNITIHAGEGDGVNSIIDALDNGAMRIGHGVRIIEDINNNKPGETAKKIKGVTKQAAIAKATGKAKKGKAKKAKKGKKAKNQRIPKSGWLTGCACLPAFLAALPALPCPVPPASQSASEPTHHPASQ